MGGFAWVTLATNDSYSLGALVLAHSLRQVNTAHQLVVLVTPGVTEAMKTQLSAVFNVVKVVDVLDSQDADNLALLARPELGITFTKLHCWRLTQYDKCVFLDADTLVLQNCDELFERDELSAAPDAGWPDCFNSGVFVYKPSKDTFNALIEFALVHGSFDGGDQGLLNLFFSDWPTKDIKKHLPFIYNMVSTASYSYLPAFKQFGHGLKIIHFIGAAKPWLHPFNTETGLAREAGESQHVAQFVQLWWDLFCSHVHPSLSTEMAGLAGALASVTLGAPLTTEQTVLEQHLRRQGWEQGNIDYMGKDAFSNIWQKICDTLSSGPQSYLSPASGPPEESPAPVAPVAAPVYVSSVEISPTGPIDTSPPASYAPVSAPKPTVIAFDSEAAAAASSETKTVPPEPKSSSFPELVSTEGSKSTTDTSSQPPVDIPAGPATPAPTTQPSTTETSAIVPMISSTAMTPALPATGTPTPLPESKTQVTPVIGLPPPTVAALPATPSEPSGQILATPVSPTESHVAATSTVDALPSTPTDTSNQAPVTPVQALETPVPASTAVVPLPAPTEPTSQVVATQEALVPAPTNLIPEIPPSPPAPVVPTPPPSTPVQSTPPIVAPTTPVPVPAAEAASLPSAVSVIPPEPTAVMEHPTPQTPVSPTDASPQIIPVDSPTHSQPVPGTVPTPLSSVPDAKNPTPEVVTAPTTPTATPGASQPDSHSGDKTSSSGTPKVTQVPAQPLTTPISALTTPSADAETPPLVEKITTPFATPLVPIPGDKTAVTQPPPTPAVADTPASVAPEIPPAKTQPVVISTPETASPVTPAQPQGPAVAEPTPPTSPGSPSTDSPLAANLQVDPSVHGTPPVGSSSAVPSVPVEEPPVPPKRKGGAKASQDSKNHKGGGKPSKGKK